MEDSINIYASKQVFYKIYSITNNVMILFGSLNVNS